MQDHYATSSAAQAADTSKKDAPKVQKQSGLGTALKKIVDWFMEDDDELLPGETPESHAANVRTNRQGMMVLYRKELADHLCSRRFWALFALLTIVSVASLYGAIGSLQQAAQSAQAQGQTVSEFQFLKLFTTAGSSIYSFQSFIGFLGPIFGIMLGFDAINNEQAQGTLNHHQREIPGWRHGGLPECILSRWTAVRSRTHPQRYQARCRRVGTTCDFPAPVWCIHFSMACDFRPFLDAVAACRHLGTCIPAPRPPRRM